MHALPDASSTPNLSPVRGCGRCHAGCAPSGGRPPLAWRVRVSPACVMQPYSWAWQQLLPQLQQLLLPYGCISCDGDLQQNAHELKRVGLREMVEGSKTAVLHLLQRDAMGTCHSMPGVEPWGVSCGAVLQGSITQVTDSIS